MKKAKVVGKKVADLVGTTQEDQKPELPEYVPGNQEPEETFSQYNKKRYDEDIGMKLNNEGFSQKHTIQDIFEHGTKAGISPDEIRSRLDALKAHKKFTIDSYNHYKKFNEKYGPEVKGFQAIIEQEGGVLAGVQKGFTKKDGTVVPDQIQFSMPGESAKALPADKFTAEAVREKLGKPPALEPISKVEQYASAQTADMHLIDKEIEAYNQKHFQDDLTGYDWVNKVEHKYRDFMEEMRKVNSQLNAARDRVAIQKEAVAKDYKRANHEKLREAQKDYQERSDKLREMMSKPPEARDYTMAAKPFWASFRELVKENWPENANPKELWSYIKGTALSMMNNDRLVPPLDSVVGDPILYGMDYFTGTEQQVRTKQMIALAPLVAYAEHMGKEPLYRIQYEYATLEGHPEQMFSPIQFNEETKTFGRREDRKKWGNVTSIELIGEKDLSGKGKPIRDTTLSGETNARVWETTPSTKKGQDIIPGAEKPSYKKSEFGGPRELPEQDSSPIDLLKADADRKQGKLFGNESGFMNVGMIPGFMELAEGIEQIGKVTRGLQEVFAPATIDQYARMTAEIIREKTANAVRAWDRMEVALAQGKNLLEKLSKDDKVDFMDRMEKGSGQYDSDRQKIADALEKELSTRRDAVRRLGTGKLEKFIEHYFPHIWKDPKKAIDAFLQLGSKRPFEGGKAFLKQRTIESIKDGVDAGLEPVSWNPVDLVMLKCREMDRYLLAHETMNILKGEGLNKFVAVGMERPEHWAKVDDNISTVYGDPNVTIKEAYDQQVHDQLKKIMDDLGIPHERKEAIGGKRWGYYSPLEGVVSKFSGEQGMVLPHEIGHWVDDKFGLQAIMFGKGKYDSLSEVAIKKAEKEGRSVDAAGMRDQKIRNDEMRALADASKTRKEYRRRGEEKMAFMFETLVHAPDQMKKLAPKTYKFLTDWIKKTPGTEKLRPILDIKPSIELGVNATKKRVGGMVINGYWYMPENAATVMNNYLSPGLRGNTMFDLYRGAGNTLNQFQLSGFFHLGFTSIDACVSKTALGFEKIFGKSHDLKGLGDVFMGATGIPAITTIIHGDKVLKAWYGRPADAKAAITAEAMVLGGGRARMDSFYATTAWEGMKTAFSEGKNVKGVLHTPLVILEALTQPILKELVPRQKMGVFYDLVQMEIERNPNVSHEQYRKICQDAWDSVDNRMGQLVYDNLFWNKVSKDLLMVGVRSVGWNLGTIRELGGGVLDTAKAIKNVLSGKDMQFTHRMAYTMALPLVTGLYGAMYQYLKTGKPPTSLKDLYFPQNGKVDSNGKEQRVSLPSYMKDIYHYYTAPWKTVTNKLAPQNTMIAQMLDNKDFYGSKIMNEDDLFMQKVLDEAKFIGEGFIPFSLRKAASPGWDPEQLGGIMPAPTDVNLSKAEQAAKKYSIENYEKVAGRTKEATKTMQDKSDVRNQYLNDKDDSKVWAAVEKGLITNKQAETIINEADTPYIERSSKHLTADQILHVYAKASKEEKEILLPIVEKKYENWQKKEHTPLEQERMEKLYEKIEAGQ